MIIYEGNMKESEEGSEKSGVKKKTIESYTDIKE